MVGRKSTSEILSKIRAAMKNTNYVSEAISAYVVPSGDSHQSEYIAACDKRREFVSGFNGSAGTALITTDKALMWTDGRYYVQAVAQMDTNWSLQKDGEENTPSQEAWLVKHLSSGSHVGVDPWLVSADKFRQMADALAKADLSLVAVSQNLVDVAWADQPGMPSAPVKPLALEYTGETWPNKVRRVREEMSRVGANCLVITALDEVAWLLNCRGSDIEYNPVFFAYVIVTKDRVCVYMDESKADEQVFKHLQVGEGELEIFPYHRVKEDLQSFVEKLEGMVWISGTSSQALASVVSAKRLVRKATPIAMMKAVKNAAEISGMEKAHVRDAVAMAEYFLFLEKSLAAGKAIDEFTGAEQLEKFRREQQGYVGASFQTISSSGPSGGIIHYGVEPDTALPININDVYLCDAGSQFLFGTTDTTRTMHFGTPSDHVRKCFTLVLKGHIQLAQAVFPTGTKGVLIDSWARAALWSQGLEYRHGTGHGVGCYLNVHEGPMSISFRASAYDAAGLVENMIVTIEPGYYEQDAFGVRVENVYRVVKAETQFQFDGKQYLTFEPITVLPVQSKMVLPEMLSAKELQWLSKYSQLCRDRLGAELASQQKNDVQKWLVENTAAWLS